MKANELMIGDWVNIYVFPNESPKEKDLFPAKITTIMTPLPNEQGGGHIECIFKSEDGGIGCAARPVNTCLPIPLTPEILEKNGWKNSAPGVWQKEYGGFVFYWEEGTGRFGMDDFRHLQEQWKIHLQIKHTHELQHAFHLCGIEKEIEL